MKKILIVDDEPMMLKIADRALKSSFETVTVLSGEEAVEAFAKDSFDMVLSDVKMPSMSGQELLKNIRLKNPDILFVFMSADDGDEGGEALMKEGASGYITKPIRAEALLRLVKELFEGAIPGAVEGGSGAGAGNTQPAPKTDLKKEEEKLPGWMLMEPMLDVTEGLKNSEDAESYLSAISIFLEHVNGNIDELAKCLQDGDIDNYTIKVHALKSTSRIIGAMVFSTMSAAMERAGKQSNDKFIRQEHDEYIKLYRRYEEIFLQHIQVADKEPIPEEVLKDMLMALKEYTQAEDFTLTQMAVTSLNEYKLPPDVEKKVQDIKQNLLSLNWEQIRVIMDI